MCWVIKEQFQEECQTHRDLNKWVNNHILCCYRKYFFIKCTSDNSLIQIDIKLYIMRKERKKQTNKNTPYRQFNLYKCIYTQTYSMGKKKTKKPGIMLKCQ